MCDDLGKQTKICWKPTGVLRNLKFLKKPMLCLAGEDGASETSQQEEEERSPRDDVQAIVDRVVNRKFAQWKRRQERELKKFFGTS